MPTGIYIRTTEHKKHISESRLKRKEKLGYLNTPEIRKKISISCIGRPSPKGMLGKKQTSKTKEKISQAMIGNKNGWIDGRTPINMLIRKKIESHLWRKSVFERDNFTCQKCGQHGGRLIAHHIFNFSNYIDLRFAINNGITFCKKCHIEFHKKYGVKNNTNEQLKKFLESKKVGL